MIPSSPMAVPTAASTGDTPLVARGHRASFTLVTSLFFLWAIPNNLNDVLIGQFMKSFTLSRTAAGLVQSAFYLGYFLLALPAALLMRKAGYKVGMIVGLVLFGSGAFLFLPAALSMRYSFFLFALFVMAGGLAFLETASSPYIAQLGTAEGAARRLNLAQAFNPLGSICGVLLGTAFIFSGIELSPQAVAALRAHHSYDAYLRSETLRVVSPYMALGILAFVLAVTFLLVRFPPVAGEEQHGGDSRLSDLWGKRHLWLSVATLFMYVGGQVGTWSYFIQYVQTYTHQTQRIGGLFLTGTLACFALGRFSSAWLMQRVRPAMLMGIYAVINVVLVAAAIVSPGWLGLWAIFSTSFFMSIMFPTIFALGLSGLGGNTKIGGSVLVMSIIGGAILTPLMGIISESRHSLAAGYIVPLAAYLCVAWFSFAANGLKSSKNEASS